MPTTRVFEIFTSDPAKMIHSNIEAEMVIHKITRPALSEKGEHCSLRRVPTFRREVLKINRKSVLQPSNGPISLPAILSSKVVISRMFPH